MGKEVGGCVTTFVAQYTCVHYYCTLPPGPHRPRPFCIWKVLMNRGGTDGSSLQQQVHEWRLCVFSSHLLPLPLCQEKGGAHVSHDRCHVSHCHSSGMRTRRQFGGAENVWGPPSPQAGCVKTYLRRPSYLPCHAYQDCSQ